MISDLNSEEKNRLINLIGKLSQLTWRAIKNRPREQLGTEQIPKSSLVGSLPTLLNDEDYVDVFRVDSASKSRLLGVRDGRIFQVCMIDPGGKCYKH